MAQAERKKRRYLSIRAKYTLMLVGLLVLLVGAQWLFNRVYLQKMYTNRKLDRISEVRQNVLDYARADAAGTDKREAAELLLRKNCEAGGITALVLKDEGSFAILLFSNSDDRGGGPDRLFELIRGGIRGDELTVYEEGDDYRIYSVKDAITGTEQIDCMGFLSHAPGGAPSDGLEAGGSGSIRYFYQLTVPVAEITETADIYNRLLLAVGLVTLLAGVAAVYFMSGSMTKPIKEITALSRKMAAMDFSARYSAGEGDEIHSLGENMNDMAAALERSVRELREANAQLEKDVAEKEKINRQRKELLANISHELKTPIAVIQGYSEGLRDGISEDPEMRERYCGVILDEAGKMNRLVRQLLSLDELESGTETVREAFDLAEMLRGEAEAFMLRSRRDNVDLQLEVPESLPVISDEFLLEQVVQNFLSNAFQHVTPGGLVRVSGELLTVKEGGGTETARQGFRIRVFNSGEAIPEEELPEIWNKFYKVDKARTRAYGGSGIGLSIVRAAMENLEGSCSARNTGGGVEFSAEVQPEQAP